ncbi:alpha/beta hydrolase fold domain-containing protein [Oleiharenicola lentus]|uniref:alpha/beta hydrolase fold domain-containing protein n=1 Tax=Oleiharenicola lentus TaxID=2508720 RepID=UPI003F68097A
MRSCNGKFFTTAIVALVWLLGTVHGAEPVVGEKRVIRGITYAQVGAIELKLDLHLPVKVEGPLPVLIWLHAGGWREGGRGFCPIANFAKEGYAVASVSYRLVHQAIFPAQIEDCKAAVRWLRAHAAEYDLDPGFIGACGESAGGHLAAMLGTTSGLPEFEGAIGGNTAFSSRVQAVVGLCAPADFTTMLGRARERSFWAKLMTSGNFSAAAHTFARTLALKKFVGGALLDQAVAVRQASPAAHVSAGDPPFLLFHGRGDPLIPLSQSEEFLKVLKAAGVESRLEILEVSTHGFGRFPPTMMTSTRAFFNRHLKPPPTQRARGETSQ